MPSKPRNPEEVQRAKIGKYFYRCLQDLDIPLKQVSNDLGFKAPTLERLRTGVPKLRVLYALGHFIQDIAQSKTQPLRPL